MLITVLFVLGATLPDVSGGDLFLASDQLERNQRYENAARSFRQCAEQSETLRPYALSRAAKNYHAAGDNEAAAALFQQVLTTYPDGPWTRLTWMRMGDMYYKQGQVVKARSYYKKVLDGLQPLPWFLDNLAWNNADYALLLPGYEQEGYAWFRHIVATTIYVAPRKDASQRLLKSKNIEDRAWGVYGYMRSGNPRDAREAMSKEAVILHGPEGVALPLLSLDVTLATAQTDLPGTQKRLGALVQNNKDSLWVRTWLMLAIREQAGNKHYPVAEMLAQLLSENFPDGRDAGDAYWWLAEKYEGLSDKEGAKRMYRQLADRHPDHVRVPRSLLYLANHARDAGKTENAYKLYDELGRIFPKERLTAEGYYCAAKMAGSRKDAVKQQVYLKKSAGVGLGYFYAHRALHLLHTLSKTGAADRGLRVDTADDFLQSMSMTLDTREKLHFLIDESAPYQRLKFFGMHGIEEGEWEALACIVTMPVSLEKLWYPAIAEAGFMHTMCQYMYDRNWGIENGNPTVARLRVEYPLAYWQHVHAISRELGVDPYLVLAIARQESTFRAGIVSSAGATGVLQLMPATASWLAKVDDRVAADHVQNLKSPCNSILLGTVYLQRMMSRSQNNMVYALASYNAGPGNCDKWRAQFKKMTLEEFADAIPFSETNEYVKKVLANYAAYHSLYPAPEESTK